MGTVVKKLGLLSIFAFPLGVILYRTNLVGFGTAFSIVKNGVMFGAVLFVIGVLYWFITRNKNPQSAKAALVGGLIALIPVIPLGLQASKAKSLPFIHNISTDIVNPPQFDKVTSLRTSKDNPLEYDVQTLAKQQQAGYPDIKTHFTELSVDQALTKAKNTAESLGWEIVNVDAEQGLLEATETTLLWGFKDDIVVRIQANADSTAVDLRSVSRFGQSDIGANAARIEKFLTKFKSAEE